MRARAAARDTGAVAAAVARLSDDEQQTVLGCLHQLIARFVDAGAITVSRTCLTCRYHRQTDREHHCDLIDTDLPVGELRINCPEHIPVAGTPAAP